MLLITQKHTKMYTHDESIAIKKTFPVRLRKKVGGVRFLHRQIRQKNKFTKKIPIFLHVCVHTFVLTKITTV